MSIIFYLIILIVATHIVAAMLWHKLKSERRNSAISYAYQSEQLKNHKIKIESQKKRILELEDGVKKAFGVSVRKEVTEMSCVFTKVEMAFLMAGVHKLLSSKDGTVEDKEFYIKLYRKIQDNIEQMEEEERHGD